jgi:hypothetical protein
MKTQKSIDKKTYSSTQVIPQLDSGRKSATRRSLTQTTVSEMTPEEFEAKLLDVDIRKPRTAYNFYMMDMQEKEGNEKNITDITKEFSKKWPKLSAKEKEKYETMAKEDKERYNEHIALVRKYIVTKPLKEAATARSIFIDEFVTEKIEANNMDPKEAKKLAAEEWKNMSLNAKAVYEEKKEGHREMFEDIKQAGTSRISAYTLFCKDKMMKAREQNQRMTIVQCAEAWNNTKQSIKDKYEQYAQEEKEEREKNRNLYELAFNVKPKRPLGPYNFYLMELAKEGKFTGMKDAAKTWHNLPAEEKEKYLKVAKKAQLAYAVKKQEYNSSVRKSYSRAKSAFNFFVQDQKVYPKELPQGGFFQWCYNKWKKEDDSVKRKYQKMADEAAKEHNLNATQLDTKVFDMPKKPMTGYNRYVKVRIPELKDKHPNKEVSELFTIIGQEWRGLKDSEKEKYDKQYIGELTEYKDKINEFKKTGYYTPSKSDLGRKSVNRSVSKSKNKDVTSTKKGKAK